MTQPAGRGATVDFRFRNGRRVRFEAHEVKVDKLLSDVKEYIASSPQAARLAADRHRRHRLPPGRPQPAAVPGRRRRPLGPRSGAACRATSTSGSPSRTPLQKAGAYLLTARMDGGNTSRIVVWLDDTVIVKKPMAEKAYYFVADARTGQPVPRPTSSSSAGGWCKWTARTSTTSRPRR